MCKEIVGQDRPDVKVAAQTYYGRLLAVNGVCELVTSQLVGVVSDKHGRRPVQVAAQLGQVPWTESRAKKESEYPANVQVQKHVAISCRPPSFQSLGVVGVVVTHPSLQGS